MIDLNYLTQKSYAIASKNAQKDKYKMLTNEAVLKYCAGEVVEAAFASTSDKQGLEYISKLAGELGDIIVCCLICACANNIDIEEAIRRTVDKNEKRLGGKET